MELAEDYTDELEGGVAVIGHCLVSGKIDSRRYYKGKYYSVVLVPAADEYSQPSVMELRSDSPVGEVGDVFRNVPCVVSGYYGKSYTFKDKESGESVTRKPVNHVIDVLSV